MNGILSKIKEVYNLIQSTIKKYKQDQQCRIMKGSQLDLYKKYLLQQETMDVHHQKVLGIILTISLIIGLIFQLVLNQESFNEQLYLTILIASQLFLKIITTSFFFFSKNHSLFIKYFMKLLVQSMTIVPIELLIIQEDTQQIVWVSFIVGAYVIGINISMKDKFFQVVSIFFQSSYLIIRVSNIENFVFVIYLERIIEIGVITAVIFYLAQDYGKIFLLNFFFENTKGNTAKSVIKSSLPLPIFATKLKTKNLDSSRLFLQNLDNLELDILFANKFCRQIFNIKKKIEMKQKLKYLFLQGDSHNNNNANNNVNTQSYNKNEYDQHFMATEFHVGSNELRQKKISRQEKSVINFNTNSQKVQQNGAFNPTSQLYKNDFWNLQRSQYEAMSPTKEDHNRFGGYSQVNGREFQIQPVIADSKQNDLHSNQNEQRGELSHNLPNFMTSGALIDGFLQQNQMKKQNMTQQFLKQNFTKQEIKDYGILMTGSQVTNLLYYHILEKLYGSLFNRLRSEANAEIKHQIQEKPNKHQTSLKDLSQQASQAIDKSQEEVFLDVLYIDSDKKRRKFFDIKVIEVEWENENAMMVIMNDISEKMRVKRMKEIDSFKNNILSTITHNLKTPLNGIILIAQSIQNQVNDEVKDALSDVLQNSKLLLYMINDILDYSRLSKGNIHLNLETFSIQKLINEVLSIYKRQTQEKGIKLNYVLMGNLQGSCKLINDFNRIKQILINLIGNAQKCTFEGSITLIFEITAQNLLLISIKDTGIGMDSETIRSIQKIQMKKTKDMRQGVGIGLLIGKSLLQLVGPDKQFKIESQVNQGSTFQFQVYLIHKESKNSNLANGIEISHLQNSLLIDKSMGQEGGASKFNFFSGRQRTNKIKTILEEVKLTETQDAFDKFTDDDLQFNVKECFSQKILPNETTHRGNTQYSQPKITIENNNTEQNMIPQNINQRRKTEDKNLKLISNQLKNEKQRNSDTNGSFSQYQRIVSNPKNINQQNKYDSHQIQKDFENKPLRNEKLQNSHNQHNIDQFDEEIDEGDITQMFSENNIPRVLSYKNNSTNNGFFPNDTYKKSTFNQPNYQEDKILQQFDSSPTSILNQQNLNRKISDNDNINGELDVNQETIQQKFKFNFYSQLTDSIYTQDSKQILNQSENNSSSNNKSPKNTKNSLNQYYSQNTQQIQIISSPLYTNQNTLRNLLQQQNQIESYSRRNSQVNSKDYISSEKKLLKVDIEKNRKLSFRNYSESLGHIHVNSQKSIAEQALPMNTTSNLYGMVLSPIKYQKNKLRHYSLNTEVNTGNNRAPILQSSSYFQNLNQHQVKSIINLDDSKNLKVSYNIYNGNNGNGRLYEFIEESRDIDENINHNENGHETYQKEQINKVAPLLNSVNLHERGRTISITEKNQTKRASHNSQVNYEATIISYFESAPRRILIVDDTVFNIKALRNLLQKYKIAQVEEAFNGQQAVQKVRTVPFDIIFMDINMPVMDGFEATKQIRNLQKEYLIQNNPIIIVVTAFGDQENKTLSFQSGADEHIEKPLTLLSIQKAIYQLIKK